MLNSSQLSSLKLLCLAAFCFPFVLSYTLCVKLVRRLLHGKPRAAETNMIQRTAIVTGGKMSKALMVARQLKKAMKLVDYPASYHNNAAGIAFADGHSEIHKWLDPRTVPPLTKGRELKLNVSTPENPDMLWMQEHSSDLVKQ